MPRDNRSTRVFPILYIVQPVLFTSILYNSVQVPKLTLQLAYYSHSSIILTKIERLLCLKLSWHNLPGPSQGSRDELMEGSILFLCTCSLIVCFIEFKNTIYCLSSPQIVYTCTQNNGPGLSKGILNAYDQSIRVRPPWTHNKYYIEIKMF